MRTEIGYAYATSEIKEQQTTNNPFWRINLNLGDRVELHPATDAWMRGNRYGVITKLAKKYVHVKMDKTGRTLRVVPENLKVIG